MRIASSVALIKALENSEISDLVEEILKTDILEVCSFHYLEKHPKLLSTALYFSLQKDSGHVGIEIFNQSCKLTVGSEIVATVLIHDFQWPIYFTTLLIIKKIPEFQFSIMECYSGIETKVSKCRKFLNTLIHTLKDLNYESSCNINCYSRREFYYDGPFGSHVYFTRAISAIDGLCRHERIAGND
ncbi:hypothetical protein GCK72_013775 [Caenorhabditis remanei]|uniref:DUF38 domain-containing protein n=1 Tax=Caenorhabditis remanei TaxID=31234 RepID=A0A6A5GPL9_CAERE|nr:hypothetical protein GCK72_013775 [Caenorhabditis remanei]KAF1757320.1 hypothetical protein GCK72_013775 [Caenorhabditis remanei]